LPPSYYTKNTFLTILNPTTPRWKKRDRAYVNFYNKHDRIGKKSLTLTSFIHLRLGAFICGFKKEENPFCYKSLPKKSTFFFNPLDKSL